MDLNVPPNSVGVIGLGRMGRRHVEVLQSLGMNIVALVDVNPDAIAETIKQFKLTNSIGFSDPHQMLDSVGIDALVVATTAPFHYEAVIAAASKNIKRILCEKPMAVSINQAREMIDACSASGTQLAINHQMRFMEQYSRVRELIDTPALGGLASIVVSASNFGLAMNAGHYFEMFRYMTASEATLVNAWFEPQKLVNPRGVQFEDASGRVLLRNEKGQAMYIDLSANAGWGICVNYICRNGQISVDELSGEIVVKAREEEYRELPTTRYGMPVIAERHLIPPADSVEPTLAVWKAMLAGQSFPDGNDGLHSLKCLVASHLSHERGGAEVSLDSVDCERGRVFSWA